MTVLKSTTLWSLLCTITVITGPVATNNGFLTPWTVASNTPWWEYIPKSSNCMSNQNKEEMKVPELICMSATPSIFNIMQESEDHCQGDDYKMTFCYQKDQEYVKIGSMVIDKHLFNNVLKKYRNWSLTNENFESINREHASKGSGNDNKPNIEPDQFYGSTVQDPQPCEEWPNRDSLIENNIVKEPQTTDRIYDCYDHEDVMDTNLDTQKGVTKDAFKDHEVACFNHNDTKYVSINSIFNPKYNQFEVTLPENIDTLSLPRIIHVYIDDYRKNMAKNSEAENMLQNENNNKDLNLVVPESKIPSDYQNILLGDDSSDLDISEVVDLLLNNDNYDLNLKAPVVFNLEKSQDMHNKRSDAINTYKVEDTAGYRKDQEDYYKDIGTEELVFNRDSFDNACPLTLDNNHIKEAEKPFHIAVADTNHNYGYSTTDSKEYAVDGDIEGSKCYNYEPKDFDSTSVSVDDSNKCNYMWQARESLNKGDTELNLPLSSSKSKDACPGYIILPPLSPDSLISTQTSPVFKEPNPSISLCVESDSQPPENFVHKQSNDINVPRKCDDGKPITFNIDDNMIPLSSNYKVISQKLNRIEKNSSDKDALISNIPDQSTDSLSHSSQEAFYTPQNKYYKEIIPTEDSESNLNPNPSTYYHLTSSIKPVACHTIDDTIQTDSDTDTIKFVRNENLPTIICNPDVDIPVLSQEHHPVKIISSQFTREPFADNTLPQPSITSQPEPLAVQQTCKVKPLTMPHPATFPLLQPNTSPQPLEAIGYEPITVSNLYPTRTPYPPINININAPKTLPLSPDSNIDTNMYLNNAPVLFKEPCDSYFSNSKPVLQKYDSRTDKLIPLYSSVSQDASPIPPYNWLSPDVNLPYNKLSSTYVIPKSDTSVLPSITKLPPISPLSTPTTLASNLQIQPSATSLYEVNPKTKIKTQLPSSLLEMNPSTNRDPSMIYQSPVKPNELINKDIFLTHVRGSKQSTIPLSLYEYLPLTTTTPSLSHTYRISNTPLPADSSYVTISPVNYKNQIAKDTLKGDLPYFVNNKLWTQPKEVPLTPVLSPSILNPPTVTNPTSYASVPAVSPSFIAPKTADFVLQPAAAAGFNFNRNGDLIKPILLPQTPVSIPASLSSMPSQLSALGHTSLPAEILLSTTPQALKASTLSGTIPLINDYTPNDFLAKTTGKDFTNILHSPTLGRNYQLQQELQSTELIPALKNLVPDGMISAPQSTKAYFTPNTKPYLSQYRYPTGEECIQSILTNSISKPAVGPISNYLQSKSPVHEPLYSTASSLAFNNEGILKGVNSLPCSISESLMTSNVSPFTYGSTPMSVPNYLKTTSAYSIPSSLSYTNMRPLKYVFKSSMLLNPYSSYTSPLKSNVRCLPTHNPFASSLIPVSLLPMTTNPIKTSLKATTPLTDKPHQTTPTWQSLQTASLTKIPVAPSEVFATPLLDKQMNNFKPVLLNPLSTAPGIPLWQENKQPIEPLLTNLPLSDSILQNNLFKTISPSSYIIPNEIKFDPKTISIPPVSTAPCNNPILNEVNNEIIYPLRSSESLVTHTKSPKYAYPPKLADNIPISPAPGSTTSVQSPLRYSPSLSPIMTPYMKPLAITTPVVLTTPLLEKANTLSVEQMKFNPISSNIFQLYPPPSDVSSPYSKGTPQIVPLITPCTKEIFSSGSPLVFAKASYAASNTPLSSAGYYSLLSGPVIPKAAPYITPLSIEESQSMSACTIPTVPSAAYTNPFTDIRINKPPLFTTTSNQNQPMPSEYTPTLVTPTPIPNTLLCKKSQWEPIEQYTLPHSPVNYSPLIEQQTIQIIPMSHLMPTSYRYPQNLMPTSYKYLPKSSYSYWSQPSSLSKNSEKAIRFTINSHGIPSTNEVIPSTHITSSPDFTTEFASKPCSKLYSSYAEPLAHSDLTPLNSYSMKTSSLTPMCSDAKPLTYASLQPLPIINQFIPSTMATPVKYVQPIETVDPMLQPLETDKVKYTYAPLGKPKLESLKFLASIPSNQMYKSQYIPQIISLTEPPTIKALFSDYLHSPLLDKDISNLQIMTPTTMPSVSGDRTPVTTQTIPNIEPYITTPPKIRVPKFPSAISNMTPCTHLPLVYPSSKITERVTQTLTAGVSSYPLSDISIDTTAINTNKSPLFSPIASPLSEISRWKTLPLDATVLPDSLSTPKCDLSVFSPEPIPITSVFPATIPENKLHLMAKLSSLPPLILPTSLPCQHKLSSPFISPVLIKPVYPPETSANIYTPLKYEQTIKPSSLSNTDVSHTSIQPLFIPASNQITPPTSSLQYSYTDWNSGTLIPISPSTASKYIEAASSIPINPFSKFSPLINSAPSELVSPESDKNFVVPSSSPISPLLNLRLPDPLLPLSNTPITPESILFSPADGHYGNPILLQPQNSNPGNSNTLPPTVTAAIQQSSQPVFSPYTIWSPKTSIPISILSTVDPLLPTISPITSIQPLLPQKLSTPSLTAVIGSPEKLHNIHPGTISYPQRLITPSISPFISATPYTASLSNPDITPTSPLYSVLPKIKQNYQSISPILTTPCHVTPSSSIYGTPMIPSITNAVNTVSSTNPQLYDPKFSETIRYSTPPSTSPLPMHPLPLEYTEVAPKSSPYWSLAPCSSIKNAPFSVISPSSLSTPTNLPCPVPSEIISAPILTPQSKPFINYISPSIGSPLCPFYSTLASAPTNYTPQSSSSKPKNCLPINIPSSSVTSIQQPYTFAEYITSDVPQQSTKLNNAYNMIYDLPETSPIFSIPTIPFSSNFNPLTPVAAKSVHSYFTNPDTSPLLNFPPIKPVPIPSLSQYKTISSTPNYLPNPFLKMKPLMSSPVSETSSESPVTIFPHQTTFKQDVTPLFSPTPLKPLLATSYSPVSSYLGTVSPTVTKYSNIAPDTSKFTPTFPTYVTPLSNSNSIVTSNLPITPHEPSEYMTSKSPATLTSSQNFFTSPSITMKPCYASQRLSYLSPCQGSVLTPNYFSNLVTNTLPNSNPYSNIVLNSAKTFSPIVNAKYSPLTSTQYKSIQPLVLPPVNNVVSPVPINSKLLSSFPFTELPQSSLPYTLSSPKAYDVTPTSVSSTLYPSPSPKTTTSLFKTLTTLLEPISTKFIPSQYDPSLVPLASFTQSLIRNIGVPPLSSTQFSPTETRPYSTLIPKFTQPLQSIPLSRSPNNYLDEGKINLSPPNVRNQMYKQPIPYKFMSHIDNRNNLNLAEYYNPYSINSFSNDNICNPVYSTNDKSPSLKALCSNLYSNPSTTVPYWKEIPVSPITQPASIDDSMCKTYPLPTNLESMQYKSNNNPMYTISANNNNIASLELQSYINNIANIKSDLYPSNADISIPLGNMLIAKTEYPSQTIQSINPSIGLRMWPSNLTLVEAKLQLKFKDVAVNNFQAVVNRFGAYDVAEIEILVENYIRNKYGDVITVPNNYSLNSQYEVIKQCSSTCGSRCNLLWPTEASGQWGQQNLVQKGLRSI